MRLLGALTAILIITSVSGAQVRTKADNANTSIDRGLSYVTKDALTWKKEHNCVSCHHAGLVIWSMSEARQRGRQIDQPVLTELTKWVCDTAYGALPAPGGGGSPNRLTPGAAWCALGLASDRSLDASTRKELNLLLKTIEGEQSATGEWSGQQNTRPPLFCTSDHTQTILATLAVDTAAQSGDEVAAATRDKGIRWLSDAKMDDDAQSLALRLVLWKRLGRPVKEWMPMAQQIRERQNPDGGWSQTRETGSDAWATGQALYALSAADVAKNDPAISRGRAFLIKTQRDDGSWPMMSRPIAPGGSGAKNLDPITVSGAAWAILGLVRSS